MDNKEITTLPARDKAIDVFSQSNGLDPYLQHIRAEIDAFPGADVATAKGRKEYAAIAYRVARSKTAIDAMGKELVSELKDLPKKIDAERKRVRNILDAWRDEVRQPLTIGSWLKKLESSSTSQPFRKLLTSGASTVWIAHLLSNPSIVSKKSPLAKHGRSLRPRLREKKTKL